MKTTRENLLQLIATTNNKIFSVTFIKKDNSVRTLVGRFGVISKLHGGKSTLDQSKFFTMYDMIAHGYRAINKETILKAKIKGTVYEVEE